MVLVHTLHWQSLLKAHTVLALIHLWVLLHVWLRLMLDRVLLLHRLLSLLLQLLIAIVMVYMVGSVGGGCKGGPTWTLSGLRWCCIDVLLLLDVSSSKTHLTLQVEQRLLLLLMYVLSGTAFVKTLLLLLCHVFVEYAEYPLLVLINSIWVELGPFNDVYLGLVHVSSGVRAERLPCCVDLTLVLTLIIGAYYSALVNCHLVIFLGCWYVGTVSLSA
jgi:hypothetical protein